VDTVSPAEELPTLYRAVLDGVAELERLGERREANRVRADAVRTYSRSWDAAGRRRLELILRRAERTLAETRRSDARASQRQAVTSS
jgi:hypothetical protein